MKKGSIADWLVENKDRFLTVEVLMDACESEMKTTRSCISGVISRLRKRGVNIPRSTRSNVDGTRIGGRGGLTKDEFQSQYDTETAVRLSIREALHSLKDEKIVSDMEFRNRCGGAEQQAWRQVSNEAEFIFHKFQCKKKTFWAAKSVVEWVLNNVNSAVKL